MSKGEDEIGFFRLERQTQPLEDRPLPPRVRHIPWADGHPNPGGGIGLRSLMEVRKAIRDYRPDLVQAGPIQRSAFLVALLGFHPLVSMSWGYDLLVDANKGIFWEWATRFTLKRSDALVADCQHLRDLAVDYGMEGDRIVTFPWGANIRKFTPVAAKWRTPIRQRLGWGQDIFVLLSTRSWAEIYGVEDLAQAFVKIAHQHPEIRLLMLGNGPLASKIQAIFWRGGVSDRAYFPGQVSQDKLPDYYRSADLYISTSHSDGTSISMLEALASGTPVLLTDIPGNREWITTPGEVGWLYCDGDVEELTRGIQHALENKAQLSVMGGKARKLAETRGDWELNGPHLFEAYNIALN